MTIRSITAIAALSVALLFTPAISHAQNPGAIDTKGSESQAPTQTSYPKDQILTATVHQAWELSGKNEANFFVIVEQLAQISAQNRGITLPDTEAAGRRIGNYIKTSAKADTDQLLYAVVDRAVRMTSTRPVHAAGSAPSSH